MKPYWPEIRLGDILQERREIPDTDDITLGKIPIVAKIGFNTGEIEFRENGGSKTNMILVRPGDILVSGINAAKGAIAVYSKNQEVPAAATIHYSAYEVLEERASAEYLWWFLRSQVFREILSNALHKGIKTELKPRRFLSLEIPLPPLSEQKRILERIRKIVPLIEGARNERQMRALPLNGKLGDVIVFKPRSGPSFATDPDWGGTPVLMPSAVTGFGINTLKVEYGIGDEKINPKDRLDIGDIIIARGNKRDQVGNAGVVTSEVRGFVCANLLMRMRLDEQIDPYFCIYWLRSPTMRNYVADHIKGTNPNIQKINQKVIMGMPFPISVSSSVQRQIVAFLDDCQNKLNRLEKFQRETLLEIDSILPSILYKAFNGEL